MEYKMKNHIFVNTKNYEGQKNIYAVANGRTIGLLDSWDACKESVNGFGGAVYKKFKSVSDAISFLENNGVSVETEDKAISQQAEPMPTNAKDVVTAYVDGSYNVDSGRYGSGVVFLNGTECGEEYSFSNYNPEKATMRNVAGEIDASMSAVQNAIAQGYKTINLCYDYEGIEKWVTGEWKSKNPFTKEYAHKMRSAMQFININFSHVKGHSGDKYNDRADVLAKKACGVLKEKNSKSEYER